MYFLKKSNCHQETICLLNCKNPEHKGEGSLGGSKVVKIFTKIVNNGSRNSAIEKPREQWDEEERRKVQYNLKAKNIITSALGMDEYFRVSSCKNEKEMWDTLQVNNEGTTDVKRSLDSTIAITFGCYSLLKHLSTFLMRSSLGNIFPNDAR